LKRRELERHLTAHGCELHREGFNHAIWHNPPEDMLHVCSAAPRDPDWHRPRDLSSARDPSAIRSALKRGPLPQTNVNRNDLPAPWLSLLPQRSAHP